MPVLSGQTSFTGMSGVTPNLVFIDTNDTVATITTAGYLTHAVQEGLLTLQNGYMALVNSQASMAPHTAKVPVWLQVAITGVAPNLVYSLVEPANGGGAIFPGNVQAGSNGIAGAFLSYPATLNTGHLVLAAASNAGNTVNTITNASQAGTRTFTIPDPGVAAASFLLTQNAGTQTIATGSLALTLGNLTVAAGNIAATLGSVSAGTTVTAGTGITATTGNITASAGNLVATLGSVSAGTTVTAGTGITATTGNITATAGNLIAGHSGAAGTLISFPAAAANGSLIIAAVANAGNFTTTLSSVTALGQATVYTLPDPANAVARVLVGATATPFATGNIVKASGTGGLMVDAGYALVSATTADIGGGGAGPLTVVSASLTAASVIVATIKSSSNVVAVAKCVAGAGNFDITFTGDPGAACVVNYVATTVAS